MRRILVAVAGILFVSTLGWTYLLGPSEKVEISDSSPITREIFHPASVELPNWDVFPEQSDRSEVLADTDYETYVYTTSPGEKLVINLADPSDEIKDSYPLAVRVWIRGRGLYEEATKNRSIGIGIRPYHEVDDKIEGRHKEYYERIRLTNYNEAHYAEWTVNPTTGEDWTWSDIYDHQALIMAGKPTDPGGGGRVVKLYVEVLASEDPDAGLLVAGPIFGGVTSSEIKAWVKTSKTCSVQIRYGTDETNVRENTGDTQTTAPILTSDDQDNTLTFKITGLAPNSRYFFTALIDGYAVHDVEAENDYWLALPYCKTFPSEESVFDFNFAIGGDMHEYPLEHDLFAQMEMKLTVGDLPHFFIDLGDYWWNESDDLRIQRDGFLQRRGYHAEARHLNHYILRKMPLFAVGSDHDGVGNNYCKVGMPQQWDEYVYQEFRRIPNANQARIEYFPLPDFDGIHNGIATEVTGVSTGGGSSLLVDVSADFSSQSLFPGMVVVHDPNGEDEAISFLAQVSDTMITLSQDLVSTSTGAPGPAFEPGDGYEIWRSCLYYKVTVGNAEFFFLDTRSKRDPNGTADGDLLDGRRYLGEDAQPGYEDVGSGSKAGHIQRDWLVNGINNSTKRWKFIVCEIPFKHDEKTPDDYYEFQKYDKWGDHDPNDDLRTYLKDNITAEGVIWLSADRHFSGLNDASHDDDPWPEVQAAPLCYLGLPYMPTPQGSWELNGENGIFSGPDGLRSAFGIVKVRSDHVDIELYNHSGVLINNGHQDLKMRVGDCWDADMDGQGDMACGGSDCDDSDPNSYLGALEICDGKNNDCIGFFPPDEEIDHDGDFYVMCEDWVGTDPNILGGGDCHDTDPQVYPGAEEICDGKDSDCDSVVPDDEADDDGDGWMGCEGDCNDLDPTVFPVAAEICDSLDNDCDGKVDEGPCQLIKALVFLGLWDLLTKDDEPPQPDPQEDGGGGSGGCGCSLYKTQVSGGIASSFIVYLMPVLFIGAMKHRLRKKKRF